jgi:hypothetical protein
MAVSTLSLAEQSVLSWNTHNVLIEIGVEIRDILRYRLKEWMLREIETSIVALS